MSGDVEKKAVIHFETDKQNKGLWVKQSRMEGLKLVEWIEKELNKACEQKNS